MHLRAILIDQQSHAAVRPWTQRSARLYHKLFSRKTLIALIVLTAEYLKVLHLSDQRIRTVHRTRKRIADLIVRNEASIVNFRLTIALKALETDAMARFAWENQHWIADVAARETTDVFQVRLDEI